MWSLGICCTMKKNRDLSSFLQGKRQKENRRMSLCALLRWTASPLPRIPGPQESSLTAVSENRLRSWVCSLSLSLEVEMLGCRSSPPLFSSLLLSPPSPLEIVTERLCRHPAGLPQGKRILRQILSSALCAVQSGTLDCEG